MKIPETYFECVECRTQYSTDEIRYTCDCGSILDVKYHYEDISIDHKTILSRPMEVWRYQELLPVACRVTFHEGGTGLYHCKNLGKRLGLKELYVKNEGENPTGSFKDRGMTVGVSKAIELQASIVGCASTGNTSASLAAYSARASIQCAVFIPAGKIALGKLAQALMFGATVCAIDGNFDDAMAIGRTLGEQGKIYLLNSINPFRLEGQRTLGYEIFDILESVDRICIPVGNAGNISAVWKAALEYQHFDWIKQLPKMSGIQSQGAAPMVKMFKEGMEVLEPIPHPETIASAIRIGNPISWKKAINAVHESHGIMEAVSDNAILEAQKLLACTEGIFVEPASAAAIAGLIHLQTMGEVDNDERIVCITTGNGLKDPDTAIKQVQPLIHYVPNDASKVLDVISKNR